MPSLSEVFPPFEDHVRAGQDSNDCVTFHDTNTQTHINYPTGYIQIILITMIQRWAWLSSKRPIYMN